MRVKAETRSFYEQAVERAVRLILSRLDEELDLSTLARSATMSPFHFHRVFRGMLGETPLELQRRLRLERAATELLGSKAPVTTLAFDAGYETHEAFTRAFRQAFGVSPSAFRRSGEEARSACQRPPSSEIRALSGVHVSQVGGPLALVFMKGEAIMDVVIENRPAVRVAAVQHVGSYLRISEAFARLGALAGPAGLIGHPDTQMIGIFHDDPETTPVEKLRSDAGLSLPRDVPLPAGLSEIALPEGRHARTTWVGPYDKLPDVWARFLGQWLPSSGERIGSGASFEIYRNNPEMTPPDELRTDLYVPLAEPGHG